MNLEEIKPYGSVVLRFSLAAVLLFFGIDAIRNPAVWASLVPNYVTALSPFSAETIVILNGIFELALVAMLVLGVQVRAAALLHALHMLPILVALGLNAVAVRDFGTMTAALALAVMGSDKLSILSKFKKHNKV